MVLPTTHKAQSTKYRLARVMGKLLGTVSSSTGAGVQRAVVNSSLRSLPPERGPFLPTPTPTHPHTAQHMTQPHAARDTQQQPHECGTQPRTQYHTHTRTQKAESRWGARLSSWWPAHCALAALPFACCGCSALPPPATRHHRRARARRSITGSGQQAAPALSGAPAPAPQPRTSPSPNSAYEQCC
jgi:hypothetical protein